MGDFLITPLPYRQENPTRPKSSGFEDRHGRTHSKLASFIGSRCHYSTLRTTNDHRFADQLKVVHLFNRRIEGIHVYVQNTRDHESVQSV